MLDLIVERSAAAGLQRYEVSAFARDGHRCRHNLNYWQFGDYLGIGAGAHGKLSFPHRVLRQVRWREPARYMEQALAGQALSQDDEVARAELPFEFMLNALRLREGLRARCSANAPACRSRPSTRRAQGAAARPADAPTCTACGPPRAASTSSATCSRCSCRRARPADEQGACRAAHLQRLAAQMRC